MSPANELFATEIQTTDYETRFTTNRWPNVVFSIPVLGEYNVANALAALSVGLQLNISVENMQIALRNVVLTTNRTQWLEMGNGARILSDVYNSNPTAAREVLKTFARTHVPGKRYVVLGDMLELGADSRALHASLADYLDPATVAGVYLIGEDIQALGDALTGKFPADAIHRYPANAKTQLATDLRLQLDNQDAVLLKASHGIHLERVLEALLK
jgi:UDP-N-acetylmuramoyl-tripeptide--D-alanyl-D-alanine ligase